MTRIACAIYTRKSSDEGLEKEFNSLDAQREACDAYIRSQKHAGWVAVRDLYDDGGLSGGSMERPALQRLLADIKAGKVQIVVVYKVDRLTRSLADFAKIVDVLDAHGASFVSVTQQFNTTTSMGRLTLNMLLSFAQFEREIAGERIRDKIAASKAKGMWMGGSLPLGYDVRDRKLVVNAAEAESVRLIFQRYAELGSVRLLGAELEQRGIVSKRRPGRAGSSAGGNRVKGGALYTLLQNPVYRGQVRHKGNVYPGQHEAIVDADLWQIVQDRLAANRQERTLAVGAEAPSLLAGLIIDASGGRLSPSHANKRGKRYRYYVSRSLLAGIVDASGAAMRVPAGDIEGLVLDRLRVFLAARLEIAEAFAPLSLTATALERVLGRASELASQWLTLPPAELRSLTRSIVETITVMPDRVDVAITLAGLAKALRSGRLLKPVETPPCVLSIGASLRRAGKGKRIVIAGARRLEPSEGLVRLVRDSFMARDHLLADTDESINAITARLGRSKGYMTALMRLSYLAPSIVDDMLAGRQPLGLTVKQLLRVSKDLPHDWAEQRALLGFGD